MAVQGHIDIVTCFALHPNNPFVFVSGSRDKTIRVWDRRVSSCVGIFGVQDPTTFAVSSRFMMNIWK